MPLIIDELYFDKEDDSFDTLSHIGTYWQSGRYKRGSGENPYQHQGSGFLTYMNSIKSKTPGISEPELAKAMGLSIREMRARKSNAIEETKMAEYSKVKKMRDDDQMSFSAIAKELGYNNESSARNIYNKYLNEKKNEAKEAAEFIKKRIDSTKGFIDVGEGSELELGISSTKLAQALVILQDQGYEVYGRSVEQATNKGKQTHLKLICPPGTQSKDVYDNSKISSLKEYYSEDEGKTFHTLEYPASMSSSRLKIRYAEDGGKDKDGVIELRRGIEDLSLGDSHYSQVRILVDGDRYLKGMAMYSDNMPDGVDVIFNTNKSKSVDKRDVLKKIKTDDPDNPFGSNIKVNGQSHYIDSKTGEKKLSLINKTREEGEWNEWSKELPSQFLSKQSETLIKQQLGLAVSNKEAEYKAIQELTNPTIKKYMLNSFASDCDSAAVHLQAAALPRQRYQVILPVTTLKDTEVYAPNYKTGETVALIRYPHGGTFEIPIVTVNNNHEDAKKILGNAKDAVGINSKVAERLSGADFDGDTVMVIPCNKTSTGKISKVHITNRSQLEDLVDFDPKMEYPETAGMKYMSKRQTQTEMGKISNLITDMNLKGANDADMAKAVKHSMVVIDAEKHKLNYKQSEIDNDITRLKKTYQGYVDPETGKIKGGASTIISRAKNQKDVTKRVGTPHTDPETGKLVYKESYEEYTTTKSGKVQVKHRIQKSTQMAETDDAMTLVSDPHNVKEVAYANYANKMKSLANQARKEALQTKGQVYEPSAAKTYATEIASLKSKITESAKNAPKERLAQIIARAETDSRVADNPGITKEEKGKIAQRCLVTARKQVGSKRTPLEITDREWEAIQAGGLSTNNLTNIIKYAGIDAIAARATPHNNRGLDNSSIRRIQALYKAGTYDISDIADAVGCSTSTVWKYLESNN